MPNRKKWTQEDLVEAVKQSLTFRQCLRLLGLKQAGGNYKTIKAAISRSQLDTSHWLGQGWLKGKRVPWSPKRPLSEILVKDSDYTNLGSLKRRLLAAGHLHNRCYECGITEWRGKPLSLHLEHKNGVNSDHRLENLSMLCPNCHSQTDTYCGKNKGGPGGIRTLNPEGNAF